MKMINLNVLTIVVSSQHAEDIELEQIQKDIKEHVIYPTVPEGLIDDETKFFINPTGRFVIGGPQGRCWFNWKKNYCRYIWWLCSSWRWLFQW